MTPNPTMHQVAVIGAGVVGCAIARELTLKGADVALIDGADDVGAGTSKANSAILHTGFDAPVGTLEARLVRRGHSLLSKYADEKSIPLQRVGATVLAWTPDELTALAEVEDKANRNGYLTASPLSPDEIYRVQPALGPGVLGGISIPDEAIICPFSTPLSFATEAVHNGARLYLGAKVDEANRSEEGKWILSCGSRLIAADWIVNAAGLHADTVEALIQPSDLRITGRRGQFVILDKSARSLVSSIILQVPSPRTKGVLITPTVFGNVLIGPTAEDLLDKSDTRTTDAGVAHILGEGRRLVPELSEHEITSTYAGIRAVGPGGYDIDADAGSKYAWAYGIRSTGLTSSMAIAEYLVERMTEQGLAFGAGAKSPQSPCLVYLGNDKPRSYMDQGRIAADANAGTVVCFCESVTKADLHQVMQSPIPPRSLDGVWRRTRAMGGRCQGFYCGATIADWFERATTEGGS